VVIIVALVLLCIGIFIIGNWGAAFGGKITYHFVFDQVKGLKENDDVQYAGIKCGRVKRLTIDPSTHEVIVTAEVSASIPVTVKDEPVINTGFTGNVYVDIIPVSRKAAAALPEKPALLASTKTRTLDGAHSPDLSEMLRRASTIMVKVSYIMDNVSDTISVVREAAIGAHHTTDNVLEIVQSNRANIDSIVRNVNETSAKLKDLATTVSPDVSAAVKSVRESADLVQNKLKEMVPKVNAALDNFVAMSKDARSTLAANRGRIDEIVEQFRESAARLNIGIEDLRRNPWKLLTRNIEADPYSQNLYDAARDFADGAQALSRASEDLRNILAAEGPAAPDVKQLSARLADMVANMKKLEEMLYEAMRKK
jgi:ABC-type transporter Mla subunit MlaD